MPLDRPTERFLEVVYSRDIEFVIAVSAARVQWVMLALSEAHMRCTTYRSKLQVAGAVVFASGRARGMPRTRAPRRSLCWARL